MKIFQKCNSEDISEETFGKQLSIIGLKSEKLKKNCDILVPQFLVQHTSLIIFLCCDCLISLN